MRRMNIRDVLNFPFSGNIEGSLEKKKEGGEGGCDVVKAWGKIVQPQEKHPKVIYVVVLESEVKRFAEKEKSPEKGKSSELQTVKASVAIENETTPTPEVDAPITNPPPSPSDQNQGDTNPSKRRGSLLVGHHPIPLRQLNHVTTTNKVESIWNANLKVSKSITIDKVFLIRYPSSICCWKNKFSAMKEKIKISMEERAKLIFALKEKKALVDEKVRIIFNLQKKITNHEQIVSAKAIENGKLCQDIKSLNKKWNVVIKELANSNKMISVLNDQLIEKEDKIKTLVLEKEELKKEKKSAEDFMPRLEKQVADLTTDKEKTSAPLAQQG
ncbi:hypothetical protein JHK82_052782 [Glycine max]|nr:hypothetical protein JHK86_052635 [Glycine max]KAG4927000.1 hypothetical protein JHK85_053486 [Glycine max]KAG5082626.1 hypothetical protein JHK84_052664 [Glycine max]KAG5085385.1 hypothetical protein JHK82_052782 [Glycine max]